jgi:hypothetical protein
MVAEFELQMRKEHGVPSLASLAGLILASSSRRRGSALEKPANGREAAHDFSYSTFLLDCFIQCSVNEDRKQSSA